MAEQSTSPLDTPVPDQIRRRRALLYGFAALGVLAIAVSGVVKAIHDPDGPPSGRNADRPASVPVARIELRPIGGSTGRGLAELVRRGDDEYLRVLAVGLRPCRPGELYQLLLSGGGSHDRLLGSQSVDRKRTFLGEAKIALRDVTKYRRLEIRRVLQPEDGPPTERRVLRGIVP